MSFFIVGVPNDLKDGKGTHADMAASVRPHANVYPLALPLDKFKVGTLDSLYALSDELGRLDSSVDQTLKTIRKNFDEATKSEDDGKPEAKSKLQLEIKVDDRKDKKNMSPEDFLKGNFSWWRQKLAEDKKLVELAAIIAKDSSAIESRSREAWTKFADARAAVRSIDRKESGSLATRSLDAIVTRDDFLPERSNSESLMTVLVVIPTNKEAEFKQTYESMQEISAANKRRKEADKLEKAAERKKAAEAKAKKVTDSNGQKAVESEKGADEQMLLAAEAQEEDEPAEQAELADSKGKAVISNDVLPDSAQRLFPRGSGEVDKKEEFVLYSMIILKKGLPSIKAVCRENRYTVREYEFKEDAKAKGEAVKAKLIAEEHAARRQLLLQSATYFSDLFKYWMHIKALRAVVECTLRFGLTSPLSFCISMVEVSPLNKDKVRALLKAHYSRLDSLNLTAEIDGADDLSGLGSDFFPYVNVNVSVSRGDL